MNWLPSFYATYGFGDTGQLQLRASRRIARPNERDLNPNLVYLSDFSARQGNPELEPVNNDLYELAYRDRFFNVDSSITLFKRRESPVISNRSFPLALDPNVLVTSPVNFGANDSVGLDLNFNVRKLFFNGLSANLGTTIANDKRQRVFNLSSEQSVQQSIHRESAKLRLAYQFDVDSVQLMINHTGPTLSGQGVNKAFTMTNFSWQHRLSPRLTLNMNVNNVFGIANMGSFVDNEVLRMHSLVTTQPRIFSLGLRYQWGGVTGDQRVRNGRGRGGDGDQRGDGMFRGGAGGARGGGFGGGPGGGAGPGI
jgi:outer membrane receptor protein involved in Fe transport